MEKIINISIFDNYHIGVVLIPIFPFLFLLYFTIFILSLLFYDNDDYNLILKLKYSYIIYLLITFFLYFRLTKY